MQSRNVFTDLRFILTVFKHKYLKIRATHEAQYTFRRCDSPLLSLNFVACVHYTLSWGLYEDFNSGKRADNCWTVSRSNAGTGLCPLNFCDNKHCNVLVYGKIVLIIAEKYSFQTFCHSLFVFPHQDTPQWFRCSLGRRQFLNDEKHTTRDLVQRKPSLISKTMAMNPFLHFF